MRTSFFAAALLVTSLTTACAFVRATDIGHDSGARRGARATAAIESRSGSTLHGKASFSETQGGVLVEIEVHGAPPWVSLKLALPW
ncbi:MAG: hypothetical protein HOP15_16330, partial [Planctomycetes bacterium]|nr:hypothetical protein [Planctomycetota bacterium]